jgi:hypothetical protein
MWGDQPPDFALQASGALQPYVFKTLAAAAICMATETNVYMYSNYLLILATEKVYFKVLLDHCSLLYILNQLIIISL